MGIFLYILRRIVVSLLLIIAASFLVFAGVRATVDPSQHLVASNDPNARIEFRESLGLDRPIITQYQEWASGVIKGDFGVSDRGSEEVSTKLRRGMTGTFELLLLGIIVAGCIGITFGVVAAIKRNQPMDYVLSGFSYFGIAVPVFAFAYVLMHLFSYQIPIVWLGQENAWLFTSGNAKGMFGQNSNGSYNVSGVIDYLRHMIMPVTVISIQLIASWSRYQRASMVEALQSDYVRTAFAKGIPKKRVYFKHAFRNSQIPMVTVIALDIGLLFQGLIYTEFIFGMSGMGRIFLAAINNGDAITIAGWTFLTATILIIANFIADIILPIIDPRIRSR